MKSPVGGTGGDADVGDEVMEEMVLLRHQCDLCPVKTVMDDDDDDGEDDGEDDGGDGTTLCHRHLPPVTVGQHKVVDTSHVSAATGLTVDPLMKRRRRRRRMEVMR